MLGLKRGHERGSATSARTRVCMFVLNECTSDARVLKEAATLAQAGYDVRIIALMGETTKRYEETNGFRIVRVRLVLRSVGSFLNRRLSHSKARSPRVPPQETGSEDRPSESRTTIRPAGGTAIMHKVLAWLRRRAPSGLAACVSAVNYYCLSLPIVLREPAHIYHAHDFDTLPVAWMAKRLTRARLVYDSHELWLEQSTARRDFGVSRLLLMKIESFLTRRADATITVNEFIADKLRERYQMPDPTVIVNAPTYEPVERSDILREITGMSIEDRILLFIGGIMPGRGIEELALSLKYLDRVSLILMGPRDNEYVGSLRNLIHNHGLSRRVHFFGPVPHTEVTRYAASADVSVIPTPNASLNYYYSSPNKLFDSMASGLPVAASNLPYLKTIIEGHDFGVTFDPASPKDIARAIDSILAEPQRYEQMRKNALAASNIYNWQNESRKLLELYQRLD